MESKNGNRARLGGMPIAVALSALAMLALPAIGIGHNGENDHRARYAGKIESFNRQTGLLVVDLVKGRKIAGLVVRRTQVRCHEDRRRHRRKRRHRRRAHGARATSSGMLREQDAVAHDAPAPAPAPEEDVRAADGSEVDVEPREVDDDSERDSRRPHRCFDHLVPGAIVLRAEMVLAYGDAFYKSITLLPPHPHPHPVAAQVRPDSR